MLVDYMIVMVFKLFDSCWMVNEGGCSTTDIFNKEQQALRKRNIKIMNYHFYMIIDQMKIIQLLLFLLTTADIEFRSLKITKFHLQSINVSIDLYKYWWQCCCKSSQCGHIVHAPYFMRPLLFQLIDNPKRPLSLN